MRALLSIERRMQDIERKFDNNQRFGKITAVKFENDRWYVKMNDGDDQTPSGSGEVADALKGEGTFKSDWQPWQSHSHETIKFSVPPKVGMQALIRSVNGTPELSTVEPFHYGPQAPSPHGKQDETVGLIHEKDDQQHWQHQTKDTNHIIIKAKKKQGGVSGLGDISGLGDLAHIGQMAGLSGLNFSSILGNLGGLNLGALSKIGDLSSLGNLATLDVSNLANLSKLANWTSLPNISGIASLGSMAKLVGMPDLAQLGNLQSIGSQLTQGNLLGSVGSMIGGGSGGAAGIPPSLGGQTNTEKSEAPKLPDVPEEGDDGVVQQKATKDFILKTVEKNKSYYKQDKDKVHVRYGEQDAKADILMDENQVKVQFKDKKAMVKWTENDLTAQMGEDDKSKVVMTEDKVTMTQGGDGATKVVLTKNDMTITQGGSTSWKMSNGKIEISIGGVSWTLDESGWQQQGGSVGHNNKLIDSQHRHDGVEPGAGLTGTPEVPFAGV